MPRRRINEISMVGGAYPTQSSPYKIFKREFNTMLKSNFTGADMLLNADLERQLHDAFCDEVSDFYFITGFTGIGKSTLLRRVLGSFENHPDMILLRMSLNETHIRDIDEFMQRFSAKLLTQSHIFLSRQALSIQKECNATNFEIFVKNHPRFGELRGKIDSEKVDHAVQLIALNQIDLEYYKPFLAVLWAEFLMTKVKDSRWVLVVDNIEGQRFSLQPEIADYFITVYNALIVDTKSSSVLACLPLRPDTFEHWERFEKETLNLDIISSKRIHIIQRNVCLSKLFEKRFEAIVESLANEPEFHKRTRTEHYQLGKDHILIPLVEKIQDHRVSINKNCTLFELSNHNFRSALELVRKVLCNGDYFEHGAHIDSFEEFKKEVERPGYDNAALLKKFYPTNVGIIFSIAILSGKVYHDGITEIPNILRNTHDVEADLLAPYIIQILYHLGMDGKYLPRDWETIKTALLSLLVNGGKERAQLEVSLREIFLSLIMNDVILPVIPHDDPDFKFEEVERVNLAPRGFAIWDLLRTTSVIMQCYREDLFREIYDNGRFKLTDELTIEQRYDDMLDLVEHYYNEEEMVIEELIARDKIPQYLEIIGAYTVCGHIFEGIKIDYDKYFRDKERVDPNLENKIAEIGARIKELEGKLVIQRSQNQS